MFLEEGIPGHCSLEILFTYVTHFSSVQSLSCVQLFATPWTAAHQAYPSITNSWSLLKLMSIKLVMPSNHLNPCHPLLLLPSVFPSIRVFSNEQMTHKLQNNYTKEILAKKFSHC